MCPTVVLQMNLVILIDDVDDRGKLLSQKYCSVTKSCPTVCNAMGYNTTGFPVLHYLPEFAQTHVH